MTSTLATRRIKPRLWTYADYCRIPADGKRHEIVDGRHYVNPAPPIVCTGSITLRAFRGITIDLTDAW